MIEAGRICMKTAGREAGKFCVALDSPKEGFVTVTGPKAVTSVKRRKCNIDHLEPTPEVIKLGKNASDDDVIAAYKKSNVFKKLEVKEPSAKDVTKAKEAERKRLTEAKKPRKQEKSASKTEEKTVKKDDKSAAKKEKPAEKKEEKPAKKPAAKKPEKKKAAKPAKSKK